MIFSVNRDNLLFVCANLCGKIRNSISRRILIATGETRMNSAFLFAKIYEEKKKIFLLRFSML